MTRLIFALIVLATLPQSILAETLWKKVKKGASEAGEAVGNTAKDVGTAVDSAATSVGNTIDSTSEMISDEATPELTRQRVDGVANGALENLFSQNETAAVLFEQSHGYAVFDARQVAIAGVAAGYGRGVAVNKETAARTYMKMATGGVGLSFGIGGFERKIIILIESEFNFSEFVENGYDATAEAGSMFGDDKESQEARFVDGRSIFVLTKKGWKVSASAAGTKYWSDPDLN